MSDKENKINKAAFLQELKSIDVENFQNWSVPVKVFSWVMIGIFSALLVFFLTSKSVLSSISQLKLDREALYTQYKEKQVKLNQSDKYRDQLSELEVMFQQQLQQLPRETEVPELVDDMSKAGRSSGLSLVSIGLGLEVPREYFIEQPISISAQGDYHAFGKFIQYVAEMPRIVSIQDFTITVGEKGVDKTGSNLEVTADASTYRYLPTRVAESEGL